MSTKRDIINDAIERARDFRRPNTIRLSEVVRIIEQGGYEVDQDLYSGLERQTPRGRFAIGVDYIPDAQNQEARINTLEREVSRIRMALENNFRERMGRSPL